jgi:hypothetical protein
VMVFNMKNVQRRNICILACRAFWILLNIICVYLDCQYRSLSLGNFLRSCAMCRSHFRLINHFSFHAKEGQEEVCGTQRESRSEGAPVTTMAENDRLRPNSPRRKQKAAKSAAATTTMRTKIWTSTASLHSTNARFLQRVIQN